MKNKFSPRNVSKQSNLSNLSYQKKLDQALNLYWSTWDLKIAYLQQKYPSLNQDQIIQKVKDIFKYAST